MVNQTAKSIAIDTWSLSIVIARGNRRLNDGKMITVSFRLSDFWS
ncbi:hypothetical protein ABIE78_000206 [Sinorhizobium fredii]|uniref:Uncharacterized protein n=1 Tax=Sinorhizobium fredii (strain USDA 257) TaxID=1185652 RepID=I3XH18_SINF2|nr:hypothetical protein USDA257_p04590 [Sinorhizobium fredii USDA 257]CEO91689.1 conserved hypothetical protein [Sinorhizobium fredii HH103]